MNEQQSFNQVSKELHNIMEERLAIYEEIIDLMNKSTKLIKKMNDYEYIKEMNKLIKEMSGDISLILDSLIKDKSDESE